MTAPSELQWLIDRMKIRDCLTRYTRGLDRHDADLIASAFWPEAHVRYGALFEGGLDDFVAWSNRSHAERWSQHSHNVTNQTVLFDEDGGADVESYVLFFHRRIEAGIDVGIGRYLDRFACRSGDWRIVSREFLVDMMLKADELPFGPGRFPQGCWGEEDPSYRRPFGGTRN